MKTQAELAEDLKAVNVQQKKTAAEITALKTGSETLLQKITDLEKIIADGAPVSEDLANAVAAVKEQAGINDDLIPDVPEPA